MATSSTQSTRRPSPNNVTMSLVTFSVQANQFTRLLLNLRKVRLTYVVCARVSVCVCVCVRSCVSVCMCVGGWVGRGCLHSYIPPSVYVWTSLSVDGNVNDIHTYIHNMYIVLCVLSACSVMVSVS